MMRSLVRSLPQFSLYVLSGGTAATVDFGVYAVLIRLGMWYIAASVMSSVLGIATTFLMNKYVAFGKRRDFLMHLARFLLVDITNVGISVLMLAVFVDVLGMEKQVAKLLTMAMFVSWNFFVYKFFVYV